MKAITIWVTGNIVVYLPDALDHATLERIAIRQAEHIVQRKQDARFAVELDTTSIQIDDVPLPPSSEMDRSMIVRGIRSILRTVVPSLFRFPFPRGCVLWPLRKDHHHVSDH